MGELTTHVLDTRDGIPAAGMRVQLHSLASAAPQLLASVATGRDGRCAGALLDGAAFRAGRYALTFHVGAYFRARGLELPDPAFLEEAVIQIGIAHPGERYHVPLLVSPWSYTTYRGG